MTRTFPIGVLVAGLLALTFTNVSAQLNPSELIQKAREDAIRTIQEVRLAAIKAVGEEGRDPAVLASALVYQYGGPQSRTRCVETFVAADNPLTGKVIICKGYGTDFEQHALYLDWHSPKVENASEQVRSIAESCLVSGYAVAIAGTVLLPITALSFLSDKVDTIETAVRACVATTVGLSNLVGLEVNITVRRKDFWLD